MIRDQIKTATTEAMKARDSARVAALRLIGAAIKNADINARTGPAAADDDALVTDVLRKMAKQRRESIEMFDAGGRAELAAAERAELAVIESFLPVQMDAAAAEAAVRALAAEIGADGPKDMGRLMGAIKARLGQSIDMGAASALAKTVLAG
ncbi:MAG: GatB/YqeY domain-containing protein [Sphingomonadaceae bacterium]|nr:GatB/YqeY domain-containing protein [Sphingomonadaceae bacterium]